MKITFQTDYQSMSEAAAAHLRSCLETKPDALICLATGGSPKGMYGILAQEQGLCSRVRGMALDEWHGIDRDHPSTCRAFLEEHVFGPWRVPAERSEIFDASADDPAAECRRMAARLDESGPFDICILGLGRNGHLGLNEPAPALKPHAHVVELDERSRDHAMLAEEGACVERGMTFGMADLLAARTIVMLVTGAEKEEEARTLFAGQVRTDCPATFLNLHPNVHVFVDATAAPQERSC
jgi:galactosamine-6-phosphate isomerase